MKNVDKFNCKEGQGTLILDEDYGTLLEEVEQPTKIALVDA